MPLGPNSSGGFVGGGFVRASTTGNEHLRRWNQQELEEARLRRRREERRAARERELLRLEEIQRQDDIRICKEWLTELGCGQWASKMEIRGICRIRTLVHMLKDLEEFRWVLDQVGIPPELQEKLIEESRKFTRF